MITDRGTAAANAISEYNGMRFDGFWSRVEDLEPEDRDHALAEATAVLAAADAVDAAKDIHRLRLDEYTVELVARALCASEFPEVSPTYAWGVQFEDGQHHYRQMARAARAAIIGQAGQS